MFSFATFGICLAITIILLIVLAVLIGPFFLLLFVTPPLLLAAHITGDRTNFFAPNGGGKPKPLTNLLTVLFCILIVLLLTGGLYTIYPHIHRAASCLMATGLTIRRSLNPLPVQQLILINNMLWVGSCAFMGILLSSLLRFWQQVKQMSKDKLFSGYVWPVVMQTLSLPLLWVTRQYLMHYPANNASLGFGIIAIGLLYGKFLFNSQTQRSNAYKTIKQTDNVAFGKKSDLMRILLVLHAFLFAYFLVRILLSL